MAKILTLLIGLVLLASVVVLLVGGESGRGARPDLEPRGTPAAEEESTDASAEGTATLPAESSTERSVGDLRSRRNDAPATHPRRRSERRLLGTVIGAGAPQRGAQVSVYSGGELIANVDSAPTGEFLLPFPVPATELVLRIDAYGFAVYELDLGDHHVTGQTQIGNIFLAKGSVLTGSVVDEQARPIEGATVVLSRLSSGGPARGLGERARSDARGTFKFSRAPAGPVTLTARAPGFGERAVEHEHAPGSEARIELTPGTELRVRVVDRDDEPVEGVKLTLLAARASAPARTGRSDRDGSCVFADLGAQAWHLRASLRGYRPGRLNDLAAGLESHVLTLMEWPRALGSVRTPTGEPPPPGASVQLLLASQPAAFAALRGSTRTVGADGAYVLDDLRPGSYRVRATADGFAPTDSDVFQVADTGKAEVPPITLDPGGALRLVVSCGTEPAVGVQVELYRTPPRSSERWRRQFTEAEEPALTDGAGELLLDGLAVGDLWLILHSEEFVAEQVGPLRVSRDSGPAPKIEVALSRGGRIAGIVRMPDGSAGSRARVHVRGEPRGLPYLQADRAGKFESQPLPDGTYFVGASLPDDALDVECFPVEIVVTTGQVAAVELNFEEL